MTGNPNKYNAMVAALMGLVMSTEDAHNQPKARYLVSIGTLNACPIHPREVFRPAIAAGAASIIFCHNHPSNNLKASKEDLAITTRLLKCGEMLQIPVLDSLIFDQRGNYTSIRETNQELFLFA